MKRPWLPPALGFASGIALAELLPSGAGWGLAGLGAAAFLLARYYDGQMIAVTIGWTVAGWLAWWIDKTPLSELDLRLEATQPALLEVRGTVAESPVLRLNQYRGRTAGRTSVAVKLDAWRTDGGAWLPAQGRVMTVTRGAAPAEVFAGQRIEISGLLRGAPGPKAPGLFDYRDLLRFRGISHLLEVESFRDWRIAGYPPANRPWSADFLPWAQRALSAGLPDDESTRLLWAMTLGWRTALSNEVSAPFIESGTMHVFAISGLHIALMSGVWVAVLRLLRIQRAGCGSVVVPAMWFYVAATGWQPSAIRSAVMMSIVVGGWALRRPGDVLNSLALAALAILVWDPAELFQAGFQLSFAAVAGLGLWARELASWGQRWLILRADPMLPEELRPQWFSWVNDGLSAFVHSIAISTAALVATLPLTIHYFHLLSPISLIANIIVVPLSSLALAANLGALATYSWCSSVAELFNAGAWLWMKAMISLSRWFADVPGGVWSVAQPNPAWWVAYYAFLLGPTWGALATRNRRRVWIGSGIGLSAAALGWTLWVGSATRLAVLAGNAVVVDAPGWQNDLVVNTGGVFNAERVLFPWLRAHGWNRIPRLVIAQADAAHTGGATNLIRELKTSEIVVGARRQRSPIFRDFLQDAERREIPIMEVQAENEIGHWSVLSPDHQLEGSSAAENALILAGEVAGVRVLVLPAKMSPATRQRIRHWATRPRGIDVVISAIPPDREPNIQSLLDDLHPKTVIVTADDSWRSSRRLARLRGEKSTRPWPILNVATVGGIELRVRKGVVVVKAADGTKWTFNAGPRVNP